MKLLKDPSACPRKNRFPRFCGRCGQSLIWADVPGDDRQRLVCRQCDTVHYLDHKVAACSVVPMDGGVVLVRRSIQPGRGMWVIPGGFVESDETVPEAAARETWEEAGLEVDVEDLVGVYSYRDSIIVVVVYTARVTAGVLEAGPECLEARVFPENRLPWEDLAFRTSRDALSDWLGRKDKIKGELG